MSSSATHTQSVITSFVFLGLELTEQIEDIFFFSYKYSSVQKQHGEGEVRVRGGKEALAGRQRDSCVESKLTVKLKKYWITTETIQNWRTFVEED